MSAKLTSKNYQQRKIYPFHGGLELDGHKSLTCDKPIASIEIPTEIILPLRQHIGELNRPVVQVGETVAANQLIASCDSPLGAPVHASYAGKVVAIEPRPALHPSGMAAQAVVITVDQEKTQEDSRVRGNDAINTDAAAEILVKQIYAAGIVGLGGAGFPTARKMRCCERGAREIDTLVINGVECEPYITCDDRLMQEHAIEIISGIEILHRILTPQEILIGIEENKPAAIRIMREAAANSALKKTIEIIELPERYPSGSEKQLIHLLTGKEVPSGQHPHQIGILCQNVGTVFAVHQAIHTQQPLTHRIVTVTGDGVAKPGNYRVAVGTTVRHLLQQCGVDCANDAKDFTVTVGGPMMGFTLQNLDAQITKTTNCLIIESNQKKLSQSKTQEQQHCIRCGKCAEVCPSKLLPHQLYRFISATEHDKAEEIHLFDCIECGCCNYVCLSHIPLVDYYRYAKGELCDQAEKKAKAERAKLRNEKRAARLAQEEKEKAEKLTRKKAALKAQKEKAAAAKSSGKADEEKGSEPADADKKKAAIQAAIARAKAKKEAAHQQGVDPKNTTDLTNAQQRQIEQAKKRRVAVQKEINQQAKETQTDE